MLKVNVYLLEDALALFAIACLGSARLHLIKEDVLEPSVSILIKSLTAFFEDRRETLHRLHAWSLLLTDEVHRRKLFLVIHDLNLLVISDVPQRHRRVQIVMGRVEPRCRPSRCHALVPLTDHALSGALRTVGCRASRARHPILAIEAAAQVQSVFAFVELLLHLLLAE